MKLLKNELCEAAGFSVPLVSGAGLCPPVVGLTAVESFRRRDCEDVMELCMYSRGASRSAFIMNLSNLKSEFLWVSWPSGAERHPLSSIVGFVSCGSIRKFIAAKPNDSAPIRRPMSHKKGYL